jgi:branched-chain amino acid transport system substrate-binding protein
MLEAPISIGVLLPRSRSAPQLGANLLAGVQLALEGVESRAGGRPIRLVVEEHAVGLAPAEQRARKLLSEDVVDLVIALLPVNVAAALQPLFEAQQVCLIASNAGENIPRRDEQRPCLFQNTLALWQANYALGAWAAERIGQRAFLAQSFYDAGYDLPFAFRLGYEHAGGVVTRAFLTNRPPDTGTFAPIFELAEREAPDLIFGSYSGRAAADFVRAFAAAGLRGRIPLLGSAFLAEGELLRDPAEPALGALTALGWDERGAPAREFGAAFLGRTGRPAEGFAALGYEAARWACAAANALAGDLTSPERIQAALAANAPSGPRGQLALEPGTRCALPASVTLREVRRHDGGLGHASIAELPLVGADEPPVVETREGVRSGWFNPYLCT